MDSIAVDLHGNTQALCGLAQLDASGVIDILGRVGGQMLDFGDESRDFLGLRHLGGWSFLGPDYWTGGERIGVLKYSLPYNFSCGKWKSCT
jgi:hypothetical protein